MSYATVCRRSAMNHATSSVLSVRRMRYDPDVMGNVCGCKCPQLPVVLSHNFEVGDRARLNTDNGSPAAVRIVAG